MDIKDNKKMWFHRRLMAYIAICVLCVDLKIFFDGTEFIFNQISPERLQYLQYPILGMYLCLGLIGISATIIILCYFHYATSHDKAFLPALLDIVKEVKK